MKILTKLRNSFKRKKKKPIKEKIPDGLQQRIKTPGDRIDCSLEKWSEGEISISSVKQNIHSCFTPVHCKLQNGNHQLRSHVKDQGNQQLKRNKQPILERSLSTM